MMTTLDWIAKRFEGMDISDLNDLEAEIAHRLIDEGYLYGEAVFSEEENQVLYYELIYQQHTEYVQPNL